MGTKRHKDDFEDDGRVIADMSGVGRPSLFFGHMPDRGGTGTHSTQAARTQSRGAASRSRVAQNSPAAGSSPYAGQNLCAESSPYAAQNSQTGEDEQLTREERRWMLLGGLKAGLTISLVYVVILGVIILALILVWTALSS